MKGLLNVLCFSAMALCLAACGQQWSWRQKVTISISTPKGPVAASSVVTGSWDMPPKWFKIGDSGGGHGAGELRGEATVLQVGPGEYLFALLTYSPETTVSVFAEPPLTSDSREDYRRALDRVGTVREIRPLSPKQYPILVTFGDIGNPATVKRVDPADLAASFGPGYALDSITMTLTDEPATSGQVESILTWLTWPRQKLLALGNGENPVKISINNLTMPLDVTYFRRR